MKSDVPESTAFLKIAKWAVLMAFNTIGALGVLLIGYGFAHDSNPSRYTLGVIDEAVTPVSQALALLGVIVTTYSIFLPLHTRPPHPSSKYVTVPIVSLLLLYGCYRFVVIGHLPELVVNGYVLMGFSGAVFRLLPYTFRNASNV